MRDASATTSHVAVASVKSAKSVAVRKKKSVTVTETKIAKRITAVAVGSKELQKIARKKEA